MGDFSQITNPETKEMLFQLTIFITILTPIVTGVVEALKKTFPNIPVNYHTLLAVVVAIGLSSLGWIFTDLPAVYRLWGGLFAGLSAAKVYDIAKNLVKTEEKG